MYHLPPQASTLSDFAGGVRWGARVRGELIEVSADGMLATDAARDPRRGERAGGRYRVLTAERGFGAGRHVCT